MSRLLCLSLLLLAACAVVSAAAGDEGDDTTEMTSAKPATTTAPETTSTGPATENPEPTTKSPATEKPEPTTTPEPTTKSPVTEKPEPTPTPEPTTTPEPTKTTTTSTKAADPDNPGEGEGDTTSPSAATTSTTPATISTKEPPVTVEDTVTINFVNDLRYGLYPFSAKAADATRCGAEQACLGGLACLAAKREEAAAAAKKALWLHAGVALGYGDLARTLKLDDAAKALDLLAFDCLSVDADALRFGLEHAKTHTLARKNSVCSNCQGLAGFDAVPAYMLHTVDGAPNCRVAVIGILGKNRASTYVAESLVSDEVASIQKAVDEIKKDNKGTLYVVIGEASDDLAQTILTQVADVSVVLHSGNDSRTESYSSVATSKALRASLAAVAKPANMQFGSVTLQLDKSTCRPASDPAVQWVSYNADTTTCTTTATETATKAKAVVADVDAKLDQAAATVGRSLRAVAGSMDTCGRVPCALGQLVADGVRTAVNKQATSWDDAVRAVIVPAVVFDDDVVLGADKLTGDAVRGVFSDDPFVCVASVSGRDLHALLVAMLVGCCEGAPIASFPQVSGMRVALDFSATASGRIAWLRVQGEDLALRTVAADAADAADFHRVALPCSYLDNELVRADKELASRLRPSFNTTSVALSDALLWRLRAADDVLVPPQVEDRVYAFVDFPTQDELCEDLTGVTVCYTFLVTGAIALISYLIYEVWRYRSTLSYVR